MDLSPMPSPAGSERAASPPVVVVRPTMPLAPVVFASPHSGRDYPPAFVAAARLDRLGLRRSEDCFVDELFAAVPGLGMPLVHATFPRAYCDANRERWELDPTMFADPLPPWANTASPRVGAGLGTVARVVASGEAIYRGKLAFAEAEARVRCCWEPFHAALAATIAATRAQFGVCLLVDCHSMPTSALPPRAPVDIVLGDAHGRSCAPAMIAAAEEIFKGLGLQVRRNEPYSGGFITRYYGRPRDGCHALQLEINRALYLDEARIERSAGFAATRDCLGRFAAAFAGVAARWKK